MSDIMTVIRKSLIQLGIDDGEIKPEARVQTDLRLDSTEAVQIALDLKKVFSQTFKLDFSNDPSLDLVINTIQLQLSNH